MSLTYLIGGGGNIFNYQNIPENYLIYRSGSNGFQTITNNTGILMNYNNEYNFGIPTAYELVDNYSDNSIVMTMNNKLVTVPVEGSSENKLLRYIDNQWKIVDFSIEYIKPELYNSNSWQLWIADDNINVINIPKDELYTYGISYSNNQFILTNLYEHNINEIFILYKNSTTSFKNVYTKAKLYANSNSNNTDLYTCIYSSDTNEIFNGDIVNDINTTYSYPPPDFIIRDIYIYYGLLIKNANEFTSNSKVISVCKNNTTSITYEDNGVFRNISNCVSFDNTIIIPAETVSNLSNFIYSTDLKIYFMIQTDPNDTAEYYWYNPRNYINIYLKRV